MPADHRGTTVPGNEDRDTSARRVFLPSEEAEAFGRGNRYVAENATVPAESAPSAELSARPHGLVANLYANVLHRHTAPPFTAIARTLAPRQILGLSVGGWHQEGR
jgi:hypothetical protein